MLPAGFMALRGRTGVAPEEEQGRKARVRPLIGGVSLESGQVGANNAEKLSRGENRRRRVNDSLPCRATPPFPARRQKTLECRSEGVGGGGVEEERSPTEPVGMQNGRCRTGERQNSSSILPKPPPGAFSRIPLAPGSPAPSAVGLKRQEGSGGGRGVGRCAQTNPTKTSEERRSASLKDECNRASKRRPSSLYGGSYFHLSCRNSPIDQPTGTRPRAGTKKDLVGLEVAS
ncbi:hypothetical protein KM043_017272 [Ampulex compressa]|nr:hypothetical protein KM043_017272 [Ampulex compressa]